MSDDERRQQRYRRRLLALVAGHVASGIESSTLATSWATVRVAERAVAIAHAILEKIDE